LRAAKRSDDTSSDALEASGVSTNLAHRSVPRALVSCPWCHALVL